MDIVGLGYWGTKYKRLLSLYNINLNLIDPKKGFYDNLQKPDAAIIVTPADTHYDIAKNYLEKGVDVLVEKPLALSSDRCEELIELANKNKNILMVGHTYLYNPAIRFIKKYMQNNDKDNEIYFILANRTNLGLIRTDIDCVWDLAPHDISITNYILGMEPLKGYVFKGYYLSKERCDIAFITLLYPKNILCNIVVGWINANKIRKIEFVNKKERIVFDDIDPLEKVKIYKKGVEVVDDKISLRDGDIISYDIKYEEPLKLQIEEFLNSVENRKEPLANGDFGLSVVRTIEMLEEIAVTHINNKIYADK